MMKFDWSLNDTIAAVSSAPGPAGRGVIRLSGPEACEIIHGLVSFSDNGMKNRDTKNHWCYKVFKLAEHLTCRTKFLFFHSPHSFTGDDVIEIHVPGSPALLKMILQCLTAHGARLAYPGEFTARAFFNGRIGLSQAEAVNEMISARSDAQLIASRRLLDGELHRRCLALREQIIELLSLVELSLDFSDQDIQPATPENLKKLLQTAISDIENLLMQSPRWEQLQHLPRVVLAGAPNAGKSTLINALSCVNRSIVSHISGTTRDLLTVPMKLPYGECLLIDTAGLEFQDIFDPVDSIQMQMREQAILALQQADLIIWVMDIAQPENNPDPHSVIPVIKAPCLIAANKIDLIESLSVTSKALYSYKTIYISALRGDNLDSLVRQIAACLHDSPAGGDGPALTTRQRKALEDCLGSLRQSDNILSDNEIENELFALELREALDHLGLLTGETAAEDVLHHIFSRFCLGK